MDSLRQLATQHNSPKKIILFLIVILLGISILVYGLSRNSNTNTPNNNIDTPQATTPLNISPHKIIYGTWSANNSLIKAFDLMNGKSYLVATLPPDIKKITIVDTNTLLYINSTNNADQGKELVKYSTVDNVAEPIVRASDSFNIDNYVISPNKRYAALLELELNPQTNTLSGGKSRVYTVDLFNPSVKHLIYDETASSSTPIHYPSAITDSGEVFLDTFLANSDNGWAYGMSVSNFEGTQKQELDNMRNGTYATQPSLSPDGKYLLFTGYDGAQGNGTDLIGEDVQYRRALVIPNKIELLDTKTKERIALTNLPTTNSYTSAEWSGSDIIYRQISSNVDMIGQFLYNPITNTSTKLNFEITQFNNPQYTATLSNNTLLVADQRNSLSSLTNLGDKYSQPILQLSALQGESHRELPISDSMIQFVAITPNSYFVNAPENTTPVGEETKQLQLSTFAFKPKLEPARREAISKPKTDLAAQLPQRECAPNCPTATPRPTKVPDENELPSCYKISMDRCIAKGLKPNPHDPTYQAYLKCWDQEMASLQGTGTCVNCPLYLYGQEGTKVTVTAHTQTYNNLSIADNNYPVTLLGNGKVSLDNKTLDSIDFDYISARKNIAPPDTGSIISLSHLEKSIREYGAKLGLNEKETNDLIDYGKAHIHSPYVFISFFDHATSHAILPLTFSPEPDTYRNIVFYFKQLSAHPGFTPDLPHFEKIERKGFTAVEVSGIVE